MIASLQDSLARTLDGGAIVITGASGFLGGHLLRAMDQVAGVVAVTGRNAVTASKARVCSVDLTDRVAVHDALESIRPAVILHAAAETRVDFCEASPAQAVAANVDATAALVDWILLRSPRTRFVYVSTDQVYDGKGPHEEAHVHPVNVYGISKLAAEQVAAACAHHLVVRTNFVGWSPQGRGLAEWLVRTLEARQAVTLVEDVMFNPLEATMLSRLIIELICSGAHGTLNLGASGQAWSKARFGFELARGLDLDLTLVSVASVDTLRLPARRPRDMSMAVGRCERLLGRTMPSMDEVMEQLLRSRGSGQ